MTPFATWLRAEMKQHGIDNRQLAQKLSDLNTNQKRIGDSTIHDWLERGALPNVRSVVLLSRYFNVSVETLIQLVGYDVVSSSADERDARRAELLARLPRFAEIAEKLARLPSEKQDAYLSVIERLLPPDA